VTTTVDKNFAEWMRQYNAAIARGRIVAVVAADKACAHVESAVAVPLRAAESPVPAKRAASMALAIAAPAIVIGVAVAVCRRRRGAR
jgi:hypothetical protein